jgi:TolB protein
MPFQSGFSLFGVCFCFSAKKGKRAFLLLFLLCLCLFGSLGRAEVLRLEITDPEVVKIPVGVAEFEGSLPLAQELSKVARRDLSLQLIFNVLGKGLQSAEAQALSSLGVNYVIMGRVFQGEGYIRTEFFLYDALNEKNILARAYRGPRGAARYMVHQFLDQAVKYMIDAPGVAFSRVAYVRRTPQGDQLIVADFDGYQETVVAAREGLILFPKFSPDGRRLAFVSYQQGRPEIHLLDLATGKRRILCRYAGLNAYPVWHPSGEKMVVTLSKEGSIDLYLIDLEGHILKRLTHGEGVNTGGSFSPDGEELAFVSDRGGSPQIYILNMSTGAVRRLTFRGSYNTSPNWSPTGDRIVYAGLVKGKFRLFTISPEGGEPVCITGEGSFEAPTFAPNGRLILCQGRAGEGHGLYLMLANGAARIIYVRGGKILFPAWTRISY